MKTEYKDMEVWAPLHAWRALGQLQAVEAINPLINLFHELEDDDWSNDDMPKVFAMIGAPALPALAVYLRYDARNVFPRKCAADCIRSIGLKHPEVKEKSARILVDQLKLYRKNDPSLNGFLIYYLVDLGAKDAIALIKEVYKSGNVDEMVISFQEVVDDLQQ
ncbi:MAG: hypothetical protein Q8O92_14410 [Candidatus Latescibacter sp.]|nr:hypothetical protein [Candidatus Latescibacter sp.]